MDYIKVLRKMCDVEPRFDKFMRTGTCASYSEFCEACCDYDEFSVVYEGRELNLWLTCGVTKACIIIEDEPVVIKIGFSDFALNHAIREADIYWEAVEAGVDEFFAPCEKIGKIYGTDIFSMLLMNVDEERVSSDMFTRCSGSMSNDDIWEALDCCEIVENLFPTYYSMESVSKLMEFLDKNNVGDLHTGNIGYDDNGDIKLIDYSGYFPKCK